MENGRNCVLEKCQQAGLLNTISETSSITKEGPQAIHGYQSANGTTYRTPKMMLNFHTKAFDIIQQ